MKLLTKSRKHDILYFMRIFYGLFLLFCLTILPAFAADEVRSASSSLSGKIISYSDGLIKMTSNGVVHSFIREKNDDFYGDYLSYRTRPIKGGRTDVYCRVLFIDDNYVIYKTKAESRVQVPRYRVSTLVLSVN